MCPGEGGQSPRASPQDDRHEGAQEDGHVQQQRPVLHVVQVVLDVLVDGGNPIRRLRLRLKLRENQKSASGTTKPIGLLKRGQVLVIGAESTITLTVPHGESARLRVSLKTREIDIN